MTGLDLILAAFLVTRGVTDQPLVLNGVQYVSVPDQTTFPGSIFFGSGGAHLMSIDPPPTGHDGVQNTSVGIHALDALTTGYNNTAVGFNALPVLTSGYWDTGIGLRAGYFTTTGGENTSVGAESGYGTTSGKQNSALGAKALRGNTTGENNVAAGFEALMSATNGYYNSVVGHTAMRYSTNGSFNVVFGMQGLHLRTTGDQNTAIGTYAMREAPSGSRGVALGYSACRYETASDRLCIDDRNRGSEANDRALALVYGVFGTTVNDQSIRFNAKHVSAPLANYPDNATAIAAGLVPGDLYHTDGVVKVVF